MRKLIFNENGDAIDAATGEIIGSRDSSGRLVIDQEKANRIKNNENNAQETSQEQVSEAPVKEEKQKSISKSTSIKAPIKYSKYEVTPDSEFTIKFYINFMDDGKIEVYKENPLLQVENMESHWVRFRMWTYKESLEWKNQCMEFDPQIRSFKQNNCKLNEIKIRHLIKDWSFEEIDQRFKLLHVQGILSDESYNVMMGLYPTILDNIIILMNNVLE